MLPPRGFTFLAILTHCCHVTIGQLLNFTYFYDPPTYASDTGNRSEWPCGGSRNVTTPIPLYDFYLLIYNQNPQAEISLLMTSGNDTRDFDVLLGSTVRMESAGWMSWYLNLTSVGVNGQTKTIQMITQDSTGTNYLCTQVQLNTNLTSDDETGTQRTNGSYADDTTYLTTYTTDGLLANGSAPRAGAITVPFSSQEAVDVTASTQPKANSGLSTGAAIGLGVAIPLVVIVLAIVAVVFFRRRRKAQRLAKSTSKPTKPDLSGKPELSGSAYDPTIAGPVKPKPELAIDEHTRHEADTKFHPAATHPELPHPSFTSANSPWIHSDDGYRPAGPGGPAHELEHPSLGGGGGNGGEAAGGGGPGEAATISSDTTDVPPSGGVTGASDVIHQQHHHAHDDEMLASEADLLVQELGLISMRKKALVSAANTQGIRPEEAPGTRGEDYRELVQREVRLRGRIAEMDQRRSSWM